MQLVDFQADGRRPMVNDRVKRAERGCARAAEQVFKTCDLMPSCPVAESELRLDRNFSTFSGAKGTEQLGMTGKGEYPVQRAMG